MKENTIKAALAAALGALCAYGVQLLVPVLVLVVMPLDYATGMVKRCAESDAWGADIHSCVHTNAANGKVMGTRMFCYSIPGKGYDACKAVFAELVPLTPRRCCTA